MPLKCCTTTKIYLIVYNCKQYAVMQIFGWNQFATFRCTLPGWRLMHENRTTLWLRDFYAILFNQFHIMDRGRRPMISLIELSAAIDNQNSNRFILTTHSCVWIDWLCLLRDFHSKSKSKLVRRSKICDIIKSVSNVECDHIKNIFDAIPSKTVNFWCIFISDAIFI